MTQSANKPTRPKPPLPDQIWVTPEVAGLWLDLNEKNRNLREAHAASFARDMSSGRWDEKVVSGVHFVDETGLLGDGQHRLRAVEISGEPQWFYVQKVSADAIAEAVDRGARRSVMDSLHFAGLTTNPVTATLARKIIQLRSGFAPGNGGRLKPSDAEIRDVLTGADSELIARSSSVAMTIRRNDALKARPGVVAVAYFQAAQIDQEKADEFFVDQIAHSTGLSYESPANALKRRLQNAAGSRRMSDVEQYNYVVYAWNHFRKGNSVKRIQEPDSWGPNGYAVPI